MARSVKNLQATEDQVVVDSPCILGAPEAGQVQELTGTQAVSLLPAATASVDGKMTKEQAQVVSAITTDGSSVFLGDGAGLNDDGSDNRNVGVGINALRSNTTGASNTANGFHALLSNTTGIFNTANGREVLRSNTTGTSNTANGVNSLYANTAGTSNTANGANSLRFNITGTFNTANGVNSLYANTTGANNTANGVNAGRFIADGTTANATSSNSVFFGADTKALADGGVNENVFGNNATGHGSNTTTLGDSAITDTYIAGQLHVAGCFGGIHVHDGTTSQSIAAGAEYTKSTCYVDNDPSANCTPDAVNNRITLTKTGYYWVYCTVSFTTGTNNVVALAAAFLDGVEQKGCRCKRKIGTGADVGNMSFGGIVGATSPNIDLDMRFVHDATGAVDITVEESNLSVQWLGNT